MADDPRVVSLHRYPVKSMLGEDLTELDLDERGVIGDRQWSVRTAEGKIGSGKWTRRFKAVIGLLDFRAALRGGTVVVTGPDGGEYPVDDPVAAEQLSNRIGQPLTFARESDVSHYDDGPVSLISLASIRALEAARGATIDPARFRANIVLDADAATAFAEDDWIGRRIGMGAVVLEVILPSPRCVMINMATADLPAQPGNLASLSQLHDSSLGVIARVVQSGRVGVGDVVNVL